ncbi:flagellar biosynthesis protein FlhF [Paenibacillus nasutitermitis]|uniref:Flagellar biosynthesis protein FlhF n=1 Tax=Paenibacillus nasutitermitis TaxID=1652958 RepID=A0A916YYQ5_9BACL|nr:flagellar biosynthesis protein FlhF [Paenibacillus nasutitermitis]GGD68234.1 flagellar biosynthesis protein FlhF [Paenibacillus nasutitermitis]
MKVKRYVVNAVPDALPMIRSDLGADAVILGTKVIRVGGFLGMFGKKKMEVIAAIDNNSTAKPPPAARPQMAQHKQASVNAAIGTITALGSQQTTSRNSAAAQYANAVQKPAAKPASLSPRPAPPPPDDSPIDLQKPQAEERLNERAFKEKQDEAAAISNEVMDELKDMKQWIVKMSKQQELKSWPEPLQNLYNRLNDQEVEGVWIDKCMSAVQELLKEQQVTEPNAGTVRAAAVQTLGKWLQGYDGAGIHPSTRVVHFVGPTGVGKTTSIAKLAAEQTLKAGRKVGFITSDTYRIAAVDQLRTYATILNVPLEVVFSPAEVVRAFTQLQDRELIFMDTAGRNFRNELYVSEVNSLLQSSGQSETFLVLSLTGKYKDMSAVAENFAKYGVQSAVFTKQDETSAYGAILNLIMEYGLKPAYLAHGQTVPDDITPFRTDRYIEQLLGASGNE